MMNILIQGLALSGLYALVAVGFTMIFSVGRVLNLAHGVFLMLGGYAYYSAVQVFGVSKGLGILLAVLVGVAFGVLTCAILVRRLEHNPIAVEIATLILAVVMQALIVLVYTSAPKSMWPIVSGVFRYEGVFVSHNILAAMVVSWIALGGLLVFVRRTRLGRALRAVSMDRKGAVISGVDPHRMSLATWAHLRGARCPRGGLLRDLHPAHPRHVGRSPHHCGRGGGRRRHREHSSEASSSPTSSDSWRRSPRPSSRRSSGGCSR